MLRNLRYASGFDHVRHETAPTDRAAQPTAALSWPVVSFLRTMWDQMGEGLAAHRHYERLRSRGMPHAAALRESLGVGRNPSNDA